VTVETTSTEARTIITNVIVTVFTHCPLLMMRRSVSCAFLFLLFGPVDFMKRWCVGTRPSQGEREGEEKGMHTEESMNQAKL